MNKHAKTAAEYRLIKEIAARLTDDAVSTFTDGAPRTQWLPVIEHELVHAWHSGQVQAEMAAIKARYVGSSA
jgi:hypothetical protein